MFQSSVQSSPWSLVHGPGFTPTIPETHTGSKVGMGQILVCWSYSGPGFYAGVNVSIRGEWHRCCTLTEYIIIIILSDAFQHNGHDSIMSALSVGMFKCVIMFSWWWWEVNGAIVKL